MNNKNDIMEKSVTLRELVNYATTACWQGYCEGSVSGDWSPTAEKWQKMQEAAEIIIRDFYFAGDDRAAGEFIRENGEGIEFRTFIGDPDILKGDPEIYDEISSDNREGVTVCQ